MILSPWVLNIHLTMFTENYFVHRLFRHVLCTDPTWLLSVLAVTVCAPSVCWSYLWLFPCEIVFSSPVMCLQYPVFRVLLSWSTLVLIVPPRDLTLDRGQSVCSSAGDIHIANCHFPVSFSQLRKTFCNCVSMGCETVWSCLCSLLVGAVFSAPPCWTLVIPGAALGRGSRQSACVCVTSVCVLCVARRGCLARVTSYNASKLELYILYLTFKAPISKITIGFIKIYL